MSIVFEVIDTNCEQATQAFFTPQVRLSPKSTTQYATLYGFSEFGTPSSPPKKYRKATVSGLAERIGFTLEPTPRQCAGAMYTWSGFSEYNFKGVLTTSYSKKFFAQCPKQYWPPVGIQLNTDIAITIPCAVPNNCKFVGYCWPDDANSCPTCSPNLLDWPLIGEVATNVLQLDLSAFRVAPSQIATTKTTYAVSGQFIGVTAIENPPFQGFNTGINYPVTIGSRTIQVQSVVTDPPLAFPIVNFNGFDGAYINFIDASAFSCVLSEEYTDADALANATIVTGTGATAQTLPRGSGFTSLFTSVVYTLFMTNLIPGKDYVVTVDLWEKGPEFLNTHTPKEVSFTASDTTHTITDVVPTPADDHTITVQKPTITFAPL